MYLGAARKYDPLLKFAVTTDRGARAAQAKKADEEIAAGKIAGRCTGLPWAPKDLLATKGIAPPGALPDSKADDR